MASSPLFLKYTTRSGNRYVYDADTNEIVRVGEVTYNIIDDYRVLSADEIVEKYRALGEAAVRNSLANLDKLQSSDVLCDHGAELSVKAERAICQGEETSLGKILETRRRLLTLELTQQCNLRCEYCCYGGHYPEFRNHGKQTMSLGTAKDAIRGFFDRCPQPADICFYGGEPLLEFGLIEQIVSYAETLASQRGIKLRFNITTNGTLLTDDKIHFFVQHGFRVWISCDGDEGSHDQYRVFSGVASLKQRGGTYDLVARNIDRFVSLYPEYHSRGISATVTATADPDACNEALSRMSVSFPLVVANLVRHASDGSKTSPNDQGARLACCETSRGQSGPCEREGGLPRREGGVALCVNDGASDQSMEGPCFCNWTPERLNRLRRSYNSFVDELCTTSDGGDVCRRFPLFYHLFARARGKLHSRRIARCQNKGFLAFRCFAGASRTFCSSDGSLFPCERTERGRLFRLGDGSSGVNVDRALCLTEEVRLLSDCGNCVVKRLCALCFAAVSELGATGRADSFAFRRYCEKEPGRFSAELQEYTAIMEANQAVVDEVLQDEKTEGWLGDTRFLMTEEQMKGIDVDIEELL